MCVWIVLKKKHSKTGEESRYQGTVLGKAVDDRLIRIEGGPAETLQDWNREVRARSKTRSPERDVARSSPSSPLSDKDTPMDMDVNQNEVTEA